MADLGDDPSAAPRARAEWEHFDGFAVRPSRLGWSLRRYAIAAVLAGLALAALLASVV